MQVGVILASLLFLMVVAYRGFSVILWAPVAALGAVLVVAPGHVAPLFTGLYMTKLADFLKLYFPVFVLGAVFGKLIELSGFSRSIASAVIRIVGPARTILSIVTICALLTYGGVSLFVVVFAVYPFAADLFQRSNIPKRLIPGTIALGSFTFTMDCLPGSPQIQNIIPTSFFKTDLYAAPWLGITGAIFILITGLGYLDWRRRGAIRSGEGYGEVQSTAPELHQTKFLVHPLVAILPLLFVAIANKILAVQIPRIYGASLSIESSAMGKSPSVEIDISKVAAIWAVEAALVAGILTVLLLAWKSVVDQFAEASKPAVAGALLASTNTASEYGYGAVIAALPGFRTLADSLQAIPDPLVNQAVTVTTLAGITGSASGGMGIALAALSETFIHRAENFGIPMEVLHRVAAMASGGMDTLPHNGAVITLLTVTGLTHRQAYADIFAITILKTLAVFFIIGVYYVTRIV